MPNFFRCEVCGTETDEKPSIIRFSYTLVDGREGVELIYLCWGCNNGLPKTNPARRSALRQLFISLYPNRQLKLD
jgi:hypothetical protein